MTQGKLQKEIATFKKELRQSFYNGKNTRVVLNEWIGFKDQKGKLQKIVEDAKTKFPRILLPKLLKKEDRDRYLDDIADWFVEQFGGEDK